MQLQRWGRHLHLNISKAQRLVEQITFAMMGIMLVWKQLNVLQKCLYAENIQSEVAVLPDELDPDDYIKKYGEDSFYKPNIRKTAFVYCVYDDACKT